MTHQSPTLDEMCDEVGIITFSRWKAQATTAWRASEYFYKGAAAKHAFEYEHIKKRYDSIKASQRDQMPMEEA